MNLQRHILKTASRQKLFGCAFASGVNRPESRTASRVWARRRGKLASGESLYNYYRDYQPCTGRYGQSDPLELGAGMNMYAYVEGNSLRFTDPYGLAGMDVYYEFISDRTGGWSPSQGAVDFWSGFGDGASLGLSNYIREKNDIDGGVNKCSSTYKGADFVGAMVTPLGRLAYIGKVNTLASKIPQTAAQAVALSMERNAIKTYFRGPVARLFTDYKTADWAAKRFEKVGGAAFANSAGKSNIGFDALAGFGILNAANNISKGCR